MLAILTKMTLTQVSTWFANARRRLKKENKMTWSPRNRCGERKDGGDTSDIEDVDLDMNSDDEKTDYQQQERKGKNFKQLYSLNFLVVLSNSFQTDVCSMLYMFCVGFYL